MAQFNFQDLGVVGYQSCWDLQEKLLAECIKEKITHKRPTGLNHFLLVEHPHVYTLGKSGDEKNLLANADYLKQIDATFIKINRGGDIDRKSVV